MSDDSYWFIQPRVQVIDKSSGIEHIWQKFWRHGFYRGGPVFMSALSGIDIALWDLKGTLKIQFRVHGKKADNSFLQTGRTLGVPVYELLGGSVRNKVQVYAWIGGDRPADVEVAA